MTVSVTAGFDNLSSFIYPASNITAAKIDATVTS